MLSQHWWVHGPFEVGAKPDVISDDFFVSVGVSVPAQRLRVVFAIAVSTTTLELAL